MQQHAFAQGSPEWHAHRAQCWNASDAPAMMGQSPYKSRAQLIKEIATGLTEDVDAGTQRLFDAGHRFEALARPGAEDIVGDDLSPLIGSIDAGLSRPLAASFDGLTFMHDVAWEHKTLNDGLRASIRQQGGNANDFLSPAYRIQMEQQCMVSGAQRVLFTSTKWDGDTLVEQRYCWYTPDLELRAQILAGWKQLEADVAAYQPGEVAPAVVAEPVEALPAVLVKVSGEISITANFAAFETRLRDFLDNRLIREPKTDQDFADLDLQIKAMKGAEAALESAEAQMLAQIQSVDAAKRTKDMLHKLVRDNRLMAEKLLASEKERRKAEIVAAGQAKLRDHIAGLTKRLGFALPPIAADIAGSIKGKKSLASMEDAIGTELARAKIEANRIADLIDTNRRAVTDAEADHLFPDFGTVCTKAAEDFANLITSRKAAAAARIEAERERIRAEEAARLEREAQARAAAEAKAKADEAARLEREQREEAERQARELQEARERAERAEAAQNTTEQGSQQVLEAEPVTADATDRDAPASTSPSVGSTGAGQPADAGPAAGVTTPLHTTYTRTLRLGEIQARLAPLSITAEGLAQLGFPAHVERGLKLYWPGDFPAICRAISDHALALASAPQQLAA